jgi:protein TonB
MILLPRTAVSLYVALAVHALVLLAMALRPASQQSAGLGQGLSVRSASLSAGERRLVLGSAAEPETMAAPLEALRVRSPPVRAVETRRLARERPSAGSAPVPVHPKPAPASPITQPRDAPRTSGSNGEAVGQVGGGGRDLYFARLRAHLAGFRRELRPGLPPARTRVRMTITKDGWIEELVLMESSGLPELDAEAMDIVRRAAPLPSPPEGRAVRLIVPVEIVPTGPR